MLIELPIAQQIHDDLELTPRDKQIWRKSLMRLDLSVWRKLSPDTHSELWGISESSIRAALERLVRMGFLYRRVAAEPGVKGRPPYEYRVPLSRNLDGDVYAEIERTSVPIFIDQAPEHEQNARKAKRTRARLISKGPL